MICEIIIGGLYQHQKTEKMPRLRVLACDVEKDEVTVETAGWGFALTANDSTAKVPLRGKQTLVMPLMIFQRTFRLFREFPSGHNIHYQTHS